MAYQENGEPGFGFDHHLRNIPIVPEEFLNG
jgi:hypothetical protein